MNKYLLIIGGIILAFGVGWYVYQISKVQPNEDVIDFIYDGNLVKDNPGLERGLWYLSYEKSGQPGLLVKLRFDAQSECKNSTSNFSCDPSKFLQGDRVSMRGIQEDTGILVRALTFAQAPADTGVRIKLYYYNPALDEGPGGAQCSKKGLVAVERVIPQTTTPLTEAIKLLLRGEISEEERVRGITSEFPLAEVSLTGASIQDGVATLTFSDPQSKISGGSCRVAILWAQIEATARQFRTVKTVRFLPEELFQP